MKKLVLATAITVATLTASLTAPSIADAATSGETTITHLAVTNTGISVYTESNTSNCTGKNIWIVTKSHPYFDAMYKGLLASKLAGRKVRIHGTGSCTTNGMEYISYAYVAW